MGVSVSMLIVLLVNQVVNSVEQVVVLMNLKIYSLVILNNVLIKLLRNIFIIMNMVILWIDVNRCLGLVNLWIKVVVLVIVSVLLILLKRLLLIVWVVVLRLVGLKYVQVLLSIVFVKILGQIVGLCISVYVKYMFEGIQIGFMLFGGIVSVWFICVRMIYMSVIQIYLMK